MVEALLLAAETSPVKAPAMVVENYFLLRLMIRGYSLTEETILTRRRVRAGKDSDFCLKAVRKGEELAGKSKRVHKVNEGKD